jgi:hypothetical protein
MDSILVSLGLWFSTSYHPRSGEVSGEFPTTSTVEKKKKLGASFIVLKKINL